MYDLCVKFVSPYCFVLLYSSYCYGYVYMTLSQFRILYIIDCSIDEDMSIILTDVLNK